jgi:hypothetical protein
MTAMAKLKISTVGEDKPIILKVTLPAAVHRDLIAYSEVLKRESGQLIDPEALVAPMLARFMATDREFKRARKQTDQE